MDESILTSIKKLLGPGADTYFDTDIIIHINTALSILTQIGVGPPEGFTIEDEFAEWSDFLDDNKKIAMVKTYVYLKVKLVFDPPTLGSVLEAHQNAITELESRISMAAEEK